MEEAVNAKARREDNGPGVRRRQRAQVESFSRLAKGERAANDLRTVRLQTGCQVLRSGCIRSNGCLQLLAREAHLETLAACTAMRRGPCFARWLALPDLLCASLLANVHSMRSPAEYTSELKNESLSELGDTDMACAMDRTGVDRIAARVEERLHAADAGSEELVNRGADAVVRRAHRLRAGDAGEKEVGLCESKGRALVEGCVWGRGGRVAGAFAPPAPSSDRPRTR